MIEEVLVLRDLRGRVRLFLKARENSADELASSIADLATSLETSLAPFWGGVLDVDRPKSEFYAILEQVRSDRQPIEPQSEFPCWWIVERCAAKSAWMSREHKPPWPLNAHTPAIMAFYSHKGGVGRTTCLCAAAVNLARGAKKVAVVDLDLEAPGLGTLLADNPVEHGVADYLLEHLVAGSSFDPDIKDYVVKQSDKDLIGTAGEPIVCVPVGRVDDHYVEKLSRIDYELVASMTNPGQSPLADLLLQLKQEFDPEYVFLDCRAGLHDLGGLAGQRLARAQVEG
ncbi:MAG TPA: AAA family ATPase, partial [Phycisphaerae bacterium]|nr:AAA family ATPase [Phycisphaerae bacterium]